MTRRFSFIYIKKTKLICCQKKNIHQYQYIQANLTIIKVTCFNKAYNRPQEIICVGKPSKDSGCCTHPAGCPDAGSLERGRGAHVEGVVALQHSVHVEVGHGVVTQPAPLLLHQRGQTTAVV